MVEMKILAGFPVGCPVPVPHFWATLSKCWICLDSRRSLSQDGVRHANCVLEKSPVEDREKWMQKQVASWQAVTRLAPGNGRAGNRDKKFLDQGFPFRGL